MAQRSLSAPARLEHILYAQPYLFTTKSQIPDSQTSDYQIVESDTYGFRANIDCPSPFDFGWNIYMHVQNTSLPHSQSHKVQGAAERLL